MSENLLRPLFGPPGVDQDRASNALNMLAEDHALLLAAKCAGQRRGKEYVWIDDTNKGASISINKAGEQGSQLQRDCELDPFGCPILTPELRASLKAALGIKT